MSEAVIVTPRPLSAKYREDFAYPTVKDRIPVILTKVVDHVYRLKKDQSDLEGHCQIDVADLKQICGSLSKLKNEIQTDKPLVALTDGRADAERWNRYLEEVRSGPGGTEPSWFTSAWLYTECYFYRRITEAVSLSSTMKEFDWFGSQKRSAFHKSLAAIQSLGEHLLQVNSDPSLTEGDYLRQTVTQLVQVCLWGNKCDLSISGGADNYQNLNPLSQLSNLESHILSDHTPDLWQRLSDIRTQSTNPCIDIVLDNAGFEQFTDLCLADFLMTNGFARSIRFHGKQMPWFVSDVTKVDFDWTLSQLVDSNDSSLHTLGLRWKDNLISGFWTYTTHEFWTLPHDYARMRGVAPDLYEELSASDLLFFKGDLNYRKLTGDLKWEHTRAFKDTLRGFHPAPLCCLRTLKSDLAVGLREGVAQATKVKDTDWLISGNWAVIQMCDDVT